MTTPVSPWTAKVTVPRHVLHRPVQDETIVMNIETEQYVGLDRVATVMFDRLRRARCVGDVVPELLEVFDVDEARLRADLVRLLEELAQHGLVALEPAT
jgi:hypothetical protein